jgi:hypothetical protein
MALSSDETDSWTILGSRTLTITFCAFPSTASLPTLMSAAGAGGCGDGTGDFKMDMGVVVGTRIGAGTAAETRCLLWMTSERGIAHCFSLAGLLRMIMRGDKLERDW